MVHFNKLFLFTILYGLSISSWGQAPWINALPMHYHASFAGNTEHLRITSNNHLYFGKIDHFRDFSNGNSLSVDKFVKKLHAGLGLELSYNNRTNHSSLNESEINVNLMVAPKFSFNGKYTLSPSLKFTTGQQSFSVRNLGWHTDTTLGIPTTFSHRFIDRNYALKGGILFNSKNFIAGISYLIMNKHSVWTYPQLRFQDRLSGMIGYTFRSAENSTFEITPILYLGSNDIMNKTDLFQPHYEDGHILPTTLYLNMKYKRFIFGISSRTQVMLGYESKKFRLMLVQSYYSSNKIGIFRSYNIQVSMRYII